MADNQLTRRDFLDYLLFTSLAATAVATLSPLPFYLVPPKGLGGGRKEPGRIKISDLADGQARTIPHLGKPALVVNQGGEITALSAVCTHAQCTVQWLADQKKIKCPCHGGEYDLTGAVRKGPPQRPLTKLAVKTVGDELVLGE